MKGTILSKRLLIIPALLTIAVVPLAGCTINIGGDNHENHMMENEASDFSSADIMFAQMMIPHHKQAVDMGTLAETRASNAEVKNLAEQIKNEQAPEIAQMKGWLSAADASMDMGHDMGMGGMLSDTQFAALEASTGAEFDRLYLEGMIGHHEGAINMAKMVLNSKNAEVKALAEAIVASQSKQITYMKELLKKLG